jgi:hypothetical protein
MLGGHAPLCRKGGDDMEARPAWWQGRRSGRGSKVKVSALNRFTLKPRPTPVRNGRRSEGVGIGDKRSKSFPTLQACVSLSLWEREGASPRRRGRGRVRVSGALHCSPSPFPLAFGSRAQCWVNDAPHRSGHAGGMADPKLLSHRERESTTCARCPESRSALGHGHGFPRLHRVARRSSRRS